MNLGDREILELNELCGAIVDATLTEAQRARLTILLRESEAARRYYVRAMGQSASLHSYAAEMHAEAPDQPTVPAPARRFAGWWIAGLPIAAALVVGGFWLQRTGVGPGPAAASGARLSEVVGRLTAAKDARWRSAPLAPGAALRKGQKLELTAGYAEVTFDSGARVVLEGTVSLEVNSAWDASLSRGTIKASVPPEAIGFRISNPAVDVVDLGTEFAMIADGQGAAEVLVLKGQVEAAPRRPLNQETILLRENESRRFADSGVSDVADREQKFSRSMQPLALERFLPGLRYAHWTFDESKGAIARAVAAGNGLRAEDVQLQIFEATDLARVHSSGPHGHALLLDGRVYAKGRFPGISSGAPHTVAFWVKVAEDAQPVDTWMVAWPTTGARLGHRPVQISWNRRPAEGALGALRTDFRGGRAVGTTSLRDGKWHHVAVCFAASDDPAAPVQVKQYLDGRLESSSIIAGAERGPAVALDPNETDSVWLGYRLSASRVEGRRFRGELDELFVADRGLEPNEIVAVMKESRLPEDTRLAVAAEPVRP